MSTHNFICTICGKETKYEYEGNTYTTDHYKCYDCIHIGCFSYPNCDESPQGCSIFTDDPEPYGHRD